MPGYDPTCDNDRLEFLGDAVLDYVVAFEYYNNISRVLFQMVGKQRYRDRKSGFVSFDFQLSKLKPLQAPGLT